VLPIDTGLAVWSLLMVLMVVAVVAAVAVTTWFTVRALRRGSRTTRRSPDSAGE
jgi:flagellar basal body-associated protein FliL